MPGSNSRPNVSEGYEVPTELPGSTGRDRSIAKPFCVDIIGSDLFYTEYRTVSFLAIDKRTYHSHIIRDFYPRLVVISTHSLYGKHLLKNTYRLIRKAVRGSEATTINLYATPWLAP